ncbi:hypothetical protein PPACK8108_LOCUS1578 [Phakopsora pachyrhizi]|uniref:Phospholipase n=1 Tax=Phakopsora pachyrhizi TaxID=170000 RepID=A0AAV0AIL2_PHAPC|nr:hypothetical protein PPACK8108_LOCUS1578 [Phakopsora pachyrhizi]
MAMDRDENDQHRVPILMNYLKLKITDSINPLHATHAVFRIELEYGNQLLKWVIYRELRDFVNLHAAYKASNIVSRSSADITLPNFPKASLPYFNILKRHEGKTGESKNNKMEFVKIQRESLEDYLLKLTKATMFVPEANRLCKFLEISALSLALANKGGFQGKQGYLRIMSNGSFSRRKRTGFHPLELKVRREPKWFIVRESYLISVDEPDRTDIYDIFLVDDEFQLKRPTRLLKQGFHMLDRHEGSKEPNSANPQSSISTFDRRRDPSIVSKSTNHTHRLNKSQKTRAVDDNEVDGYEDEEEDWLGDPDDPSAPGPKVGDSKKHQNTSSHVFYIINSERKVKLIAKNERQMDQFITSIERMVARSIWHGKNRFDSFAPIRMNVSAQWLVDGRDYFWNLSKAILLAKETIYIHDWWLSPELYLRRPPAQNQRWRLDRLLERKANEGVEIFVIIYKEVSNGFTPVESGYTKSKLLALSPNIHIQRSPSHTGTGNLLWSHHEKLCVIDETIAFMGGLDLCFGRWDSPGHVLIDDSPGGLELIESVDPRSLEAENCQIWPGKDYSNQRVSDFFNLSRPDEDMYDRDKVPRQPWHDIGLQLVGQPARDLCRHFVQRWNYLLRTKNHTRLMPFLIPPSDFTPFELTERHIIGTCEAQICRSCGPWSMGTPNKIEHSIQNAYVKAIQLSQHFVYIENQFFITSCIVDGTVITNQIGDALVNRIIKANAEGTPWKAIIVIPTMPGYPSPLNEDAAGSVRLIVECQNRSICRGETSIFSRLRAEGIDPNEYIMFFTLRGWGKLKTGQLTTEGIYIHAKAMIVDDRVAIIGSANINERSQRGDRDSELACVIRDTDMIDSTMAGQPFKVGRFAHTMRIRLMREHLGVDVDALETEEANLELISHQVKTQALKNERKQQAEIDGINTRSGSPSHSEVWDPDRGEDVEAANKQEEITHSISRVTRMKEAIKTLGDKVEEKVYSRSPTRTHEITVNDEGGLNGKKSSQKEMSDLEVPGSYQAEKKQAGGGESVPTLEEVIKVSQLPFGEQRNGMGDTLGVDERQRYDSGGSFEGRSRTVTEASEVEGNRPTGNLSPGPNSSFSNQTHDFLSAPPPSSSQQHASRKMRGHRRVKSSPFNIPIASVEIDPNGFEDPISDNFLKVWLRVASRNTVIYRKVFRCLPDDNVTTWQAYKDYQAWENRHRKPIREDIRSSFNESGGSNSMNTEEGVKTQSGNGHGNETNNNQDSLSNNNSSNQEVEHQDKENKLSVSLPKKLSIKRLRGTSVGDKDRRRLNSQTPSEPEGGESKNKTGGSEGLSKTLSQRKKSSISRSGNGAGGSNGGSNGGLNLHHSNGSSGNFELKKSGSSHLMDEGFLEFELVAMEEMLKEVQGNLVLFPTKFMESEDLNNNFLFQKDRIPPLAIYN